MTLALLTGQPITEVDLQEMERLCDEAPCSSYSSERERMVVDEDDYDRLAETFRALIEYCRKEVVR